MRSLLLTLSTIALSSSVAFAQTPPAPPPPGSDAPTAEQPAAPPPPPPNPEVDDELVDGPEGGAAMHEQRGGPDRMGRHGGPRHHMRGDGPRHHGGRGMRRAQGPEFKVEIDDDGGVKVEVKCGPREDARACADITMELLDRAYSD